MNTQTERIETDFSKMSLDSYLIYIKTQGLDAEQSKFGDHYNLHFPGITPLMLSQDRNKIYEMLFPNIPTILDATINNPKNPEAGKRAREMKNQYSDGKIIHISGLIFPLKK